MSQRGVAVLVIVIGAWLTALGLASADRVILTPEGMTSQNAVSLEYLEVGKAYRANIALAKNLDIEYAGFHDLGPKDSHALSVQCALGRNLSIGVSDLEDCIAGAGSLYGGRAYYLAAAVAGTGIMREGEPVGLVLLNCGIGTGSLKGPFAGVGAIFDNHMAFSAEYDTHSVNYGVSYLYTMGAGLGSVRLNSIKGDLYLGVSLGILKGP